MTMPNERKNAINRTRQFLLDIIAHKYEDDYNDLWYTARKCLKEYLESEEEKSGG